MWRVDWLDFGVGFVLGFDFGLGLNVSVGFDLKELGLS